MRRVPATLAAMLACGALANGATAALDGEEPRVGHINYESPHANPIALLPDDSLVYAANTPADTVDVIDARTREVVARISVGIDPVSIAVRPDGKEVWVSNHISDSVSVIDSDPGSRTRHQVVATIQQFDAETRSTRFDEPVGIAFANNRKAYVALSSSNRIAVIDVAERRIVRHLQITAQDPRALAVHENRLYVIPFESNNKTQISGCWPEHIDGVLCTFDARKHVTEAAGGNAQSLSLNYVADIVKHPDIPDRDLYVFDTRTDRRRQIIDTLGTLLYGIAVDSRGRVFVTQADARNDANGKAGTRKHGLAEMENRAFLNRITRVNCGAVCSKTLFYDLEPLPPEHPDPGDALATPYGIAVSGDDATLVVTAAASSKVFTMSAATGRVLGSVAVGAIPRGVALETDAGGAPATAWVHNSLENSISVVDLADLHKPTVVATIPLADPSEPELKLGRIAFNDAAASTTGTFSCASCHPDGHTDQLLWVLDTPLCDVGCDQIQPRLVQDIRGLRGSAPYHWDGIPGDPFGGVNTANIEKFVEPNCDGDYEESCTLHVLEGSLESTMCAQPCTDTNDEGQPGLLSAERRAAMAKYLLSVPYPPSPERPYTNELTPKAREGIRKFQFEKQCGNCHRMPFWTTTNMGGSGMDVPSWRGANDRWKNAPQNRFFFADLVRNDTRGFPERFGFTNDSDMFQMILEGSIGFSGALGRQVTLSQAVVRDEERLLAANDMLNALERVAREGGVVLQADGVRFDEKGKGINVALQFSDGRYRSLPPSARFALTRDQIRRAVADGEMLVTITARLGRMADYAHPQPTLRPFELPVMPMFPGGRPAEFPELYVNETMHVRGEHIFEGARLLVDGRRVAGTVRCESGELPNCVDDVVLIELDELPETAGMHLLQVQNPEGLYSNDFIFHVLHERPRAKSGNLIASGGRFNSRGRWGVNLTNASVTWDGQAAFTISRASAQPWRVQLTHAVAVVKGVEYSLCYSAKGADIRYIEANVDTAASEYQSVMGTDFAPEVGAAARGSGASLSTHYHQYHHRFISTRTDRTARVTFSMAQSDIDVEIDNVGLYRGRGCGTP